MRRATALVVAAGLLAVALTGCSSNPNASCDGALPSGKASDLVSATGKIGGTPKIDAPYPIDSTTSQRTILTQGSGEQVQQGQVAEITFSIVDGKSGQVAQNSTGETPLPLTTSSSNGLVNAITKGLQCTTVGSRVAIVASPETLGQAAGGSSAVIVVDVLRTSLSAANGAVRPSVSGFPTVVLAPTGQPGITIPSSGGAPSKVRSEVLKAGDGTVVKKEGTIVLQYTAVGWESKQPTTSSWSNGGPDIADMATGQSQIQSADNSVLPQSMLGELVGQKVGSQLVIETPKDGSRPAEAWVVDILGVL